MPCVRRKIAPGRAASPIFLGKRETMGESLRGAKFAPYPVGADYISARGHYRRRNPARAHMQCAPTGAPQCPAPTGVYAEHLTYGTFSIIYIIYYIFIYMYCTYVLKMASKPWKYWVFPSTRAADFGVLPMYRVLTPREKKHRVPCRVRCF